MFNMLKSFINGVLIALLFWCLILIWTSQYAVNNVR